MLRLIYLLFISLSTTYGLDNGLVRKPPMGWMSWAKFFCQIDCIHHPFTCISEKLYKQMADRLYEDGYKNVGYNYIHVDDCWMERERDAEGRLVANKSRFPSGIAKLADYIHSKGLKFGIYEDVGTKTCAGYPGSFGFEKIDAETFAEWNVDYLKFDGCFLNSSIFESAYVKMGQELNVSGRAIVYSCSWPAYLIDYPEQVDYKLIGEHCNLWRNFDDIERSWSSIKSIIDYYDHNQNKLISASGPGKWNDPDMIIVGNTELTPDQARVQMTIWSIWSAPLIMSNDLRLIAPIYRNILQNKRVIAIDQDELGIMGRLVANSSNVGLYVKPVTPYDSKLMQYSYAVAILNRNTTHQMDVKFTLERIGLKNPTGYEIQDLWTGEKLGLVNSTDTYRARVNPTGIHFFKATPSHIFSSNI